MSIKARMIEADYAALLRISDARKAENKALRERAQANTELVAVLSAQAQQRGQSEIDWTEYFRNVGIN